MIKHIRWQILLVFIGIGLLIALLAFVAFNFTTEWVAGRGGTYVEGLAGTPQFINPLLCQANEVDGDLCSLVFNGLTRLNHHGQLEPDLAERWEQSPDGLSYTFHLRPDLRWHDGIPLTASDVVFTLELIQDPSFPGPVDWRDLWRTVTVTQLDEETLRFDLEQPFAPFLDYTTVGILPRHILQDVSAIELPGHPFNLNPVGTGVFKWTEIVTDTGSVPHIILSANPFFHGRRPQITRIQFKLFPNDQAVFQAYLENEVQGVAHISNADLTQARGNEDLQLFSSTLPRYSLIYFNLASETAPFLAEREVRQALLYALDRQAIIDNVLDGQGVVVNSPILADSWAYDPSIPTYAYDPEETIVLLEEAGWLATRGSVTRAITSTSSVSRTIGTWFKDREPLAFSLLVSDDPEKLAVAEEISRQWAAMGIAANIEPVSSGFLTERLEPRDYEAALVDMDLTTVGDPDPYAFWHQTQIDPPGQNYAGYDDREMSEILEQARLTADQQTRTSYYHQFQQRFAQDVPAILLFSPVYNYAVDRYVYGVHVGPLVRPGDRFLGIADWFVRWRRVIRSSDQDDVAGETLAANP